MVDSKFNRGPEIISPPDRTPELKKSPTKSEVNPRNSSVNQNRFSPDYNRKIIERRTAEEIGQSLKAHDSLQGPEALTLQRDALNIQLRALRLKLKNSDGFVARLTKAGRERIASINREIAETRAERDNLEVQIIAWLPPEALSKRMISKADYAREKIGSALEEEVPLLQQRAEEKKEKIPLRDQLRSERESLVLELGTLRFWQFNKKQAIQNRMRVIDRETSKLINTERGY